MMSCGKIRRPVFSWRRSHADKNHLTSANCFAGIRREDNLLLGHGALQHLLEVLLIDGDFPRFQLIDPCLIDIRAEYLVTRCRQASSGHQSNVATPNHRKAHCLSPLFWSSSAMRGAQATLPRSFISGSAPPGSSIFFPAAIRAAPAAQASADSSPRSIIAVWTHPG